MITILEEQVYGLEENEFNKEELLRFSATFERPELLSFLVKRQGKIAGVYSVYDFLENREYIPVVIQKSENGYRAVGTNLQKPIGDNSLYDNVFFLANQLFTDNNAWENRELAVIDEKGQCQCILRYEANRIFGEKKEGTVYDSFQDIYRDDLLYDFTLLERFQTFVFYEYHEYTDYLVRVIRKQFPDKVIICLDSHMEMFYPEVCKESIDVNGNGRVFCLECESKLSEYMGQLGNVMFVSSDYENEYGTVKRYLTGVYSSLNVMKSLLWCGRSIQLGTECRDKQILLLDYSVKGSGLVDIIKFTAEYCLLARKRGFVPVVDIRDENGVFTKNPSENIWELFSLPVSEIPVEQARKGACVISAKANGIRLVDWEMNPYLYEEDCGMWEMISHGRSVDYFRQFFRVKNELWMECREALCKEFKEGKKILGVVARGTDYRKEALLARGSGNYVTGKEIQLFLCECKRKMEEGQFDFLYLATEDQEYFELFQKEFNERLLYHNQKRIVWEPASKGFISDFLKQDNPTSQVRSYCHILTALSHCDDLCSTMACGAFLAGKSKLFY